LQAVQESFFGDSELHIEMGKQVIYWPPGVKSTLALMRRQGK
jgi:hypothetical protein